MSHNPYRQILRYIHVVDNTSAPTRIDPNYDRMWKVRPLNDLLQHTCGEMYNLEQQLLIDESMLALSAIYPLYNICQLSRQNGGLSCGCALMLLLGTYLASAFILAKTPM